MDAPTSPAAPPTQYTTATAFSPTPTPAPVLAPSPALSRPPVKRSRWPWIVAALLIAAAAAFWFSRRTTTTGLTGSASPAGPAKKSAPAVPVLATPAIAGDIGVYLTGLGTVTPFSTVLVKSRVDGQLMKVLFTEGQLVTEGDVLAEIDPRPYAVQVSQAEGQLTRDEALLKNARLDLERYKTLWDQKAVSQQTLSSQETTVAQYEGSVKSDQAQLDNAKLSLAYARITAPISGQVGLRRIDSGNMIRASDSTGLVTITQVQPITAVFTIPQDHLPPVVKKLRAGEKLTVTAFDREQKLKLATGHLLTVDNQIDPATGTLKCKALFENADGALFPNQFVNIRLLVELKPAVVLVPPAAIQRGAQQSTFVYVVTEQSAAPGAGDASPAKPAKPEHIVSVRPVIVGTAEGESVEIQKGLQAGDIVVLEGVDKLQNGGKVAVTMRPPR